MAKKVIVTQTGSSNRRPKVFAETLLALGLGKIGSSSAHELTPSVAGMIKRVSNLVDVRVAEK